MTQRPLEEEQVKFRDVSACFSEEEWKTLDQWQKDFYQNVMKEIHQALFLMGYQIVHPDNLLQIYKAKDAYVPVSRDAENTNLPEPVLSSHPDAIPDVLFRISYKEGSDCGARQHLDDPGGGISSSSCFPVVTAAFSLTKEQELQLYPMHQQKSQRRENRDRAPTGFPVWERAVSLENEDKSILTSKGFPYAGKESHAEPSSGRTAISDVVSSNIEEENDDCFIEQDCEIIDISASEGDEGMNSPKEAGESLAFCTTEASEKALLMRTRCNMFQNSYEGPGSPPWADNCIEVGEDQGLQFESDASHTEYIGEQQEIAKAQTYPNENGSECDKWNSQVLNGVLCLTNKDVSHNPPEYNPQSRRVAKRPRVRAFPCLNCEKSFFCRSSLMYHYRTHTGERPHVCPFCTKTYSRSHHLKEHIRLHTGERPHTCPVCQQTFIYKSHFNSHRRKKHGL
ncbi:uncharacterized protein LOC144770960 isoform X2 [Lissotriton helveticus]